MSEYGVIKTYYFESKSFKELKDQISKHWITFNDPDVLVEGFAYAILENHKDVAKQIFDNDNSEFKMVTTIRWNKLNGVCVAEDGYWLKEYMSHEFFKNIDKTIYSKDEEEYFETLFNFYLTKA
jgi:uncharacterized pyridoxamine 5'-phosphate oxidase family protein